MRFLIVCVVLLFPTPEVTTRTLRFIEFVCRGYGLIRESTAKVSVNALNAVDVISVGRETGVFVAIGFSLGEGYEVSVVN